MNKKHIGRKQNDYRSLLNRWVILYRIAWCLLIALSVFGIGYIFIPKSNLLRHYHKRRLELEAENRKLEIENRILAEKQRRFKSESAFVELTAREAGMIKTNEQTFRTPHYRQL